MKRDVRHIFYSWALYKDYIICTYSDITLCQLLTCNTKNNKQLPQLSVVCICVITASILVDLYPVYIRKALTHMNAHTNGHLHTTTHTIICNTQICTYIYVHNTTHTCTQNTMCTQDGDCPIHIGSQQGHDRIVEILLQAGATVDLQNKVENSFFFCQLCCAMRIIHCTLSTTQHSKKYQCQKTHSTHKYCLICMEK